MLLQVPPWIPHRQLVVVADKWMTRNNYTAAWFAGEAFISS